jgi:ADP-ribose pyrophosphatase YjhB (NUDIX family)
MEIGETLEQTAECELFEETGLKARNFKFVDNL